LFICAFSYFYGLSPKGKGHAACAASSVCSGDCGAVLDCAAVALRAAAGFLGAAGFAGAGCAGRAAWFAAVMIFLSFFWMGRADCRLARRKVKEALK